MGRCQVIVDAERVDLETVIHQLLDGLSFGIGKADGAGVIVGAQDSAGTNEQLGCQKHIQKSTIAILDEEPVVEDDVLIFEE